MKFKNEGLTVGELTVFITSIIILFLVWSGFNKNTNQDKTSMNVIYKSELYNFK
tara:strand:+ start:3153 stop:3314 length:162 start_codon:yes stop_codon:yes gene_type:complete